MTTKEDLVKTLKALKPQIMAQYKVKEIGLFGSCVRGEERGESDIDILVDFSEVPDLFEFYRLERDLERLLGRKVDLVRKPVIREELREKILSEAIFI